MKGFKPTKAKFHIGIMAGGRVHSSVDEKQHFEIEMWPMGLFIKGAGVATVVSYNNVISFDVVPDTQAAPATPPERPRTLAAAPSPSAPKTAAKGK